MNELLIGAPVVLLIFAAIRVHDDSSRLNRAAAIVIMIAMATIFTWSTGVLIEAAYIYFTTPGFQK